MGCIKYMLAIGDFETLSLYLQRELNNAATANPKNEEPKHHDDDDDDDAFFRKMAWHGMKRPWTWFYEV